MPKQHQNGNNVERVYRKISSFRQSRNKFNNLFPLCRKDKISFDIAKTGNNVEATFDFV